MDSIRKIIKEEVYSVLREMDFQEDPLELSRNMVKSSEERLKALEDELRFRESDSRVSNLPKDEKDVRNARVKEMKEKVAAAKSSLDMAKRSEMNSVRFSQSQDNEQTQQQSQSQTSSQI